MTATQLLAQAMGVPLDSGDEHCFYCASPCDQSRPLYAAKVKAALVAKGAAKPPKPRDYLKPTFTDWASVAWPDGDYCCTGCSLALEEKTNINGRSGQKMRNYSWVLTLTEAVALTKADLGRLRAACLNPPQPPYAIVLAASGQKHTLFRAPANQRRDVVCVQLETEQVSFRPSDLATRIRLVCELVPAAGKLKLAAGPLAVANLIALERLQPDRWESLAAEWSSVYGQPLSMLAIFLSPRDGVVDL